MGQFIGVLLSIPWYVNCLWHPLTHKYQLVDVDVRKNTGIISTYLCLCPCLVHSCTYKHAHYGI